MQPKGVRYGGRSKGTPNKFTADVKQMILHALEKTGGVDYLVQQSKDNPGPFLALVGKVLPMQLETTGDTPGLSLTVNYIAPALEGDTSHVTLDKQHVTLGTPAAEPITINHEPVKVARD